VSYMAWRVSRCQALLARKWLFRTLVRQIGSHAAIPAEANEKAADCPPWICIHCNCVERLRARLKEWRAVPRRHQGVDQDTSAKSVESTANRTGQRRGEDGMSNAGQAGRCEFDTDQRWLLCLRELATERDNPPSGIASGSLRLAIACSAQAFSGSLRGLPPHPIRSDARFVRDGPTRPNQHWGTIPSGIAR